MELRRRSDKKVAGHAVEIRCWRGGDELKDRKPRKIKVRSLGKTLNYLLRGYSNVKEVGGRGLILDPLTDEIPLSYEKADRRKKRIS